MWSCQLINQSKYILILSTRNNKFTTAITLKVTVKNTSWKRVIKHFKLMNFLKEKCVWKSEGSSRIARPKREEVAQKSYCKMVEQFE